MLNESERQEYSELIRQVKDIVEQSNALSQQRPLNLSAIEKLDSERETIGARLKELGAKM